ncbi:MAG: FHIPEP family type III secretion protein, partial [Pseudomonadota bacterium]
EPFEITMKLMTTRIAKITTPMMKLSEGHTGPGAAGGVIEGFSRFIVSGNFIIGVVIFAILVVINFIVISKGSTRIAEVSARFSLDAMPGKQMAIDADLGAGLIDEAEARERRKTLEDESSFFGAMDGASKFVRGDAVAGIIITLINIIGGILIGVLQYNLAIGEAVNAYTVLTIGDGLVTQIPALIVSLAAGIIVTKGGTEGAANEAVLGQLSNYPKALYMAGVLLFGIGLLPGFPLGIFTFLALLLAGLGYITQTTVGANAGAEAETPASEEDAADAEGRNVEEALRLDEIRLEVGSALVPLIRQAGAAMPGKIKSLRTLFARDFGFVLPSVRIKDEPMLGPNEYAILIHGVEAARGQIRPTGMLVIAPPDVPIKVSGEKTKDPTFGLDALWIDRSEASAAEEEGLTVVDPESVITTHLTEVIKEHMADLLTFGATQSLIESLDREYQKLVADIPGTTPMILVQQVLQQLLRERVSIRNLTMIVEAIAEATRKKSDLVHVTNHVRERLSNQICRSLADDQGFVSVIALNAEWEKELASAIGPNGDETNIDMSPSRMQEFVLQARKQIQEFAQKDEWPAIMVSPNARSFVRSLLERVSPMTQVISHNEIHRKAALKTVGRIGA